MSAFAAPVAHRAGVVPVVSVRRAVPVARAVSRLAGRSPQPRVSTVPSATGDFAPETDLELSDLTAISPVDGRYGSKVQILRACFSEYALVRARVIVEVRWLQKLASIPQIVEVPPLSASANEFLEKYLAELSPADAQEVKKVERTTNHDVKAVEYVIKDKLVQHPELAGVMEFVHFACTSEDINNLAHALMLKSGVNAVTPFMDEIVNVIAEMAKTEASTPMMSRTHGQPASPTTLGKVRVAFPKSRHTVLSLNAGDCSDRSW